MIGAGTTHIQIIADDKAVIADEVVAEGTKVKMLYSLTECALFGLCVLSLINGISDDLFCFRERLLTCFGKADGCAFPFASAAFADQ